MPEAIEPSCAARGLLEPDGRVRLVTRNLSLMAEGQSSLAPTARHPSALDLLVLALVTDLLSGLHRAASRSGLQLLDAELSVTATLDNPLVALGVIGETGSAALAAIQGSVYVHCDAAPAVVDELWQNVLAISPVYATLQRCAELRLDLKPVS